MPFERASGVLAHPTSFPGPHGIGDLGDAAHRFIEWLSAAEQHYWQIMPLVPVGPGNSPYASVSAFAANPLLISLPGLVAIGLLEESDLADAPDFPSHAVDYAGAEQFKDAKLRRAFDRYRAGAAPILRPQLATFLDEEASWVHDFALFMALKHHFHGAWWPEWDADIAFRHEGAVERWQGQLRAEADYHAFVQFLFSTQWADLKQHANDEGIGIIGDIPIFVAHDSADVWANQKQFRLDANGKPAVVAGVPPDYFSTTGQLWGNPHYDWPVMAADGYRWWIERFRSLLRHVDVIRIDHFRGFAAAWVVPAGATTAAAGRWERGPGAALFDAIRGALGDVPIIVEDLGLITDDVRELRRTLGLPGMAVLQFAFGGDADNVYLPHNFTEPVIVYPGTHDNQTTRGWFEALDDHTRSRVQSYLGMDGSDIAWDLIRLAMSSTSELSIYSMQDVMRQGDEARMNTPGVGLGNWTWRFDESQLGESTATGLAHLTETYGRIPIAEEELREPDPYDYTAAGTEHPLSS